MRFKGSHLAVVLVAVSVFGCGEENVVSAGSSPVTKQAHAQQMYSGGAEPVMQGKAKPNVPVRVAKADR